MGKPDDIILDAITRVEAKLDQLRDDLDEYIEERTAALQRPALDDDALTDYYGA